MNNKTRFSIVSVLASMLMLVNLSFAEGQWQGPDQVLAAAKAGDAEAQLEMGILYEYGFFLSDNKAPALAWYSLAADQGNVKAAQLRDKLQATMTSAEIQQADELKPTLSVAPKQPVPESAPGSAPESAPTTGAAPAEPAPEVTAVPPENKQ